MEHPWLRSYEQGVPPTINYPHTTLPQFLYKASQNYPNHPAMIFYGRRWTYQQLEEQSNQFSDTLIRMGIRKGERVALMLPNCPQYVIGFYGCLKAGAIVVQTNPLYVERELEEQLNDSGAETIVALDQFFPRIQAIMNRSPLKRVLITRIRDFLPFFLSLLYPIRAMKEGQRVSVKFAPPVFDLRDLMSQMVITKPVVATQPEDIALLQYTGGTTGTPKGVMLTHNNLIANVYQCRHWMPTLREGKEVFMAVIPFFHVYGMSTCMNLSVLVGGCLVLLPRFATKDVLKTVVKYKVSLFMGVQAMYVAINNYPDLEKFDLSSIRLCISGAGPLHVEVQERFEEVTGGKLVEGYGLSEASPVTHCTPIEGRRKKGSIGLPFPDTLTKVVDLVTGNEVTELGTAGELLVKGPQVMQGYWKQQDETDQVIRDGWLWTGDIATMDQDGYFYIVDRKKDMIKTRGENVYPREVEEVLFLHPQITEAVVVGIPDSFSVEIIKAYVVLKENAKTTEEEIREFCRKELAPFKVPKVVEFRKDLPKTMIGKVLRRMLLEEELRKKKGNSEQ